MTKNSTFNEIILCNLKDFPILTLSDLIKKYQNQKFKAILTLDLFCFFNSKK